MSHSNPPIELELQLQYRGELASTITHIKPEGRDARTPLLMGIFDSHLNVLTLNKVEPRMKEVVWGNGQMRARWVLKRGSDDHIQMVTFFHDASRTIAESCPISTIGSAWFKETGKLTRHVIAKAPPSRINSSSQLPSRRRVRTKRSYNKPATTQDSAAQVPVAVAEHPQTTGQQTSVAATDPRIMSTQQLAAKLSALNVRASTNPDTNPTTTNTLKRKRTDDSLTSPSSKRPHTSPIRSFPSSLTIPSFTLSVRRPNLLNDSQFPSLNTSPSTPTFPSRVSSPTQTSFPSEAEVSTLPTLSFHQHRIDLSGVRATLLRSVQKQLGRTRAQLGEAGAQLAMMGAELARERELREQLQRERENDSSRRLEVTAAMTLPPSPPHSPASVLPVPPLGSRERPLTLEEEMYASDSDMEESEKEEEPANLPAAPSDEVQRKAQEEEFALMAAEIRGLRETLVKERTARQTAEETVLSLERSLTREYQQRLQVERKLEIVEGVAPAAVPAVMLALARIARLTDKVIEVGGEGGREL